MSDSMANGINWGLLTPFNQIDPLKTATPMARPAQTSNQPSLLSGLSEGLSGIKQGIADVKSLFGSNPVATASNAVNNTMQGMPQNALANMITGQGSQTNLKGNQYNPPPGPSTQNSPNSPYSISQVQNMARQTFPTNPIMQQMATAQAAQESGLLGGKPSQLATQGNNLFGMKGQGTAGTMAMPTQEYMNGQMQKQNANFAQYKNPQDSMNAYKQLMSNPRYAGVMNAQTFGDAAQALVKGGYATDPKYAQHLTEVNTSIQKMYNTPAPPQEQPKPMELPATGVKATPAPPIQSYPKGTIEELRAGGQPLSDDFKQSGAYTQATEAYQKYKDQGIAKSPMMAIVDYSKPANQQRMSIVNMDTGKQVFSTYVAHGKGSGGMNATQFSNTPDSHQSSLGTFVTQETYDGKHGQSMRINGLDKGVNDQARNRSIVIHGANYVGEGKSGRSYGCFAVPDKDASKVENLLGSGSLIQAYYPQSSPSKVPGPQSDATPSNPNNNAPIPNIRAFNPNVPLRDLNQQELSAIPKFLG